MEAINRAELSKKIENGEPFNINVKYAGREMLMIINSVMAKLLSKADHLFLQQSIITILREIIVNAQKANAKRIYFRKNNLDINNVEDYQRGIEKFKNDVIGDFEGIKKDLENSEYYIDLYFERTEKKIYLKVTNNAPVIPEELARINLRIRKAMEYNHFSEVYEEIQDETEGAGLGIVLTILFLKSMGVDPKHFKINSDGKVTETELTIPEELRPSSITTDVRNHIIDEVDGIPTFPENILALQQLCSDPEASIDKISEKIMLDPALSVDVIKLSNSAGFITGKRIESVNTAVMTIGLKNLNAILIASNARRILDKRYSSYEKIWEHCNKTSFYARAIALKMHLSAVVEKVFIAGLLHDLGKIVLLSTRMDLVKKVAQEVKDREIIASTIMEEITVGISHSTIGGLISKKWNLPDYLIEAINYHHSPLSVSKEQADLVFIVYLANMLCGIEDRKYTYYYLEEIVLERFDILHEDKFSAFHEELKAKYEQSTSL